MSNYFLTDLDGVSVNWLNGFCNFMQYEKGYKPKHQSPQYFSMVDIFDLEKPYHFINEYHHSNHYKFVDPYNGAFEFYSDLKDMGFKIIAISKCGEDEKVLENRLFNIDLNFNNIFDDVLLLGINDCKSNYLNKFSESYFVDDIPNNVKIALKYGHKSFLFDRSYNVFCESTGEDINDLKRVKNYKEIINKINKNT